MEKFQRGLFYSFYTKNRRICRQKKLKVKEDSKSHHLDIQILPHLTSKKCLNHFQVRAPEYDLGKIDRLFRWRRTAPPIDFGARQRPKFWQEPKINQADVLA
jgi:hypothetical protein